MDKKFKKKITICIATYNQSIFLEEAINSALTQDYPRKLFEIIVINDGSIDNTSEILSKYGKEIKVIHQKNHGLPEACNRGIEEAMGEYFIRLDSDDIFAPKIITYLSRVLDLDYKTVAAFSDRVVFFNNHQETILVPEKDLYSMIGCGVMMRTEQLRQLGGYRKVFWEEYDLFIRLSKLGSFKHVQQPFYYYRRHNKNMTSDIELRKKGWLELISIHGKDAIIKAGNYAEVQELRNILK